MAKQRADIIIAGVGRRIGEARRARGWTQQKAADELGIEVQSWQRFERGENTTIGTLVGIANALGVPVRSLFDRPASMAKKRPGRPNRDM